MHWLYLEEIPNWDEYDEWEDIIAIKHLPNLEDAKIKVQAYSFGDRFLVQQSFCRHYDHKSRARSVYYA